MSAIDGFHFDRPAGLLDWLSAGNYWIASGVPQMFVVDGQLNMI
jgi:hypothetical protein